MNANPRHTWSKGERLTWWSFAFEGLLVELLKFSQRDEAIRNPQVMEAMATCGEVLCRWLWHTKLSRQHGIAKIQEFRRYVYEKIGHGWKEQNDLAFDPSLKLKFF